MGMAPLYGASASPGPSFPDAAGRDATIYANRVNFQLRNTTPPWHGSVGHDAPQIPCASWLVPARHCLSSLWRVGTRAWLRLHCRVTPCGLFAVAYALLDHLRWRPHFDFEHVLYADVPGRPPS